MPAAHIELLMNITWLWNDLYWF